MDIVHVCTDSHRMIWEMTIIIDKEERISRVVLSTVNRRSMDHKIKFRGWIRDIKQIRFGADMYRHPSFIEQALQKNYYDEIPKFIAQGNRHYGYDTLTSHKFDSYSELISFMISRHQLSDEHIKKDNQVQSRRILPFVREVLIDIININLIKIIAGYY